MRGCSAGGGTATGSHFRVPAGACLTLSPVQGAIPEKVSVVP